MPRQTPPLSLLLVATFFVLAPLTAQKRKSEPVTEERLQAAYADAQAACGKVLGAKLAELPPLRLVDTKELAEVIIAENLPAVRRRQPDEAKAKAEAEHLGNSLAALVYAKYAWSTTSFLVVAEAWERNSRVLKRPALTSDHALRAVMVHELCHAIDDRKFGFAARLLEADTVDAIVAFNAVLEGHAQLMARRVCAQSGWSDGFDAFTGSIGAVPQANLDGSANSFLVRASAAAIASSYIDGERFATAVVQARPETGSQELFASPPKDGETILRPEWYLDPKTRPALLYDAEPALDAFIAKFDAAVWSSTRNSATGQQLATGLTMLEKKEVDAMLASLRAARLVRLVPTASPESKAAILIVMEFDSEDAARRWVEMSGRVSDHKDETMDKGVLRITGSKTTVLDRAPVHGLVQEKKMRNGRLAFDVAAIDACKGRIVVETVYSGEPPPMEEHVQIVELLLAAVTKRK